MMMSSRKRRNKIELYSVHLSCKDHQWKQKKNDRNVKGCLVKSD